MLWQRIATAVVLLAVLLPTMFILGPVYWGLLSLVFLATAGWEWRRLQSRESSGWVMAGTLLIAGSIWLALEYLGSSWFSGTLQAALKPGGTGLLVIAVLYWLIGAPAQMRSRRLVNWGPVPVFLLLFACWLALYELRKIGVDALLAAMCIVWIADIGAYFVGRAFGRRKLAPGISPGKSWEGAIGGAFFVVVVALLAAAYPGADATLPTRLVGVWGPLFGIIVLAALSALSVLGDLHESLLKRQAGVKDSGRSLPGHGGVLDRIDALLPTMPAVALLHQVLA